MNPKVSVIMGIYNCENTLATAIDSIVNQTYTNWELIMCDDGSKDNTYQIAQQYQKKYATKIVLLKNEVNLRLAATLNKCLEVAKGEYVARMDADDISMEDRFKKQVEFLDQNPDIAVVGCGAHITDGTNIIGTRCGRERPTEKNVLLDTTFIHPTIMMRKSVYTALGGYTVSNRTMRGQDWDLWFRFYAAGYKGYNIQEPLFLYHESPDDYKKRTLKAALGVTQTVLHGYKILKVPKWKYVFALKPVVSYFIPETIKKGLRHEMN